VQRRAGPGRDIRGFPTALGLFTILKSGASLIGRLGPPRLKSFGNGALVHTSGCVKGAGVLLSVRELGASCGADVELRIEPVEVVGEAGVEELRVRPRSEVRGECHGWARRRREP
jgi:hypothetical protein